MRGTIPFCGRFPRGAEDGKKDFTTQTKQRNQLIVEDNRIGTNVASQVAQLYHFILLEYVSH